jgi:polyisoprenoid-binding protein YceI
MKRILAWIGALALVAFGAGGALAWWQAKGHWTLVVQEGEPAPSPVDEHVQLLDERVQTLATDLRALTQQLETNLGVLDERGEERAQEASAQRERQVAGLREELAKLSGRAAGLEAGLAGLQAQLRDREEAEAALAAAPAPMVEPAAEPEPSEPEPAATEPEPEPPPRRASFLAFELPSDDFSPDERRTWTVVPALSRVGFDGTSTLHDFSGTTSDVAGELSVALEHPGEQPAASIRVVAGSLKTGEEGRDEGMYEHLDVEDHPDLRFELAAFEPERVDLAAGAVDGLARGRMTIRGVERELELPVKLRLDDAHRLSIEGEVELALPDYEVPIPSKLGLIKMGETVRVWIALRARLEPRSEG